MKSKIIDIQKINIKKLQDFQGDFKKLSTANYRKLKKSIEKNGFIQPFFVWQKKNKYFLLDGHQRKKAIRELYDDIDVDCLLIDAKTEKEAKEMVVFYSSSYGEFTKESFWDFTQGLEIDEFAFPEFDPVWKELRREDRTEKNEPSPLDEIVGIPETLESSEGSEELDLPSDPREEIESQELCEQCGRQISKD